MRFLETVGVLKRFIKHYKRYKRYKRGNSSMGILLNAVSFWREALATFVYYYAVHPLRDKLVYANGVTVFGVNVMMHLPFMNSWLLVTVLLAYNYFPESNTKLILGESGNISAWQRFYLFWLFFAAEVAGAAMGAIANLSSDYYYGRPQPDESLAYQTCPMAVPGYMAGCNVSACSAAPAACVTPASLRSYWVFHEAFATMLYTLLLLHVFDLTREENEATPPPAFKSPLSHTQKYMSKIWTTSVYIGACDFVADVAFPAAAHSLTDLIYDLMVVGYTGTGDANEPAFRALGGALGMLFTAVYFWIAYENRQNYFCTLLAWNEELREPGPTKNFFMRLRDQ